MIWDFRFTMYDLVIFYSLECFHTILASGESREAYISFTRLSESYAGCTYHLALFQQMVEELP